MVYTSYFAKMKDFPDNFIAVSIARKPPVGYCGFEDRALAPNWDILNAYKANGNEQEYTKAYNAQVLDKLDAHKLIEDYKKAIPAHKDIVFLCYEKSGDFCHRNLVRKWLNEAGIECKEY